ncbi:MAG: D-amino-acid transaminase [Rhodospirillales bacterium]|nr:D-amino-acid transaminase [Rhodospirillales bacterium]
MARIAYVNGRYQPFADAQVHIEDRGYQLADGVYEVVAVHQGRPLDVGPHLERLKRSLSEVAIAWPLTPTALRLILDRMIRKNRLVNGLIYIQITRGVARRDHAFPKRRIKPALTITARHLAPTPDWVVAKGVRVITQPDLRWKRCDIKAVGLLPNVLAKQAARAQGAFEAWLVDENGRITEGASTNAWIVTKNGTIVTRPLGPEILAGVTRRAVRAFLAKSQGKLVERPFTLAEALQAKEAFLTSATSWVLPVVSIDGHPIGNGQPGPVALGLRAQYAKEVAQSR